MMGMTAINKTTLDLGIPEKSHAEWELFKKSTSQDVERLTAKQAFCMGYLIGGTACSQSPIPVSVRLPDREGMCLIYEADKRNGVIQWEVAFWTPVDYSGEYCFNRNERGEIARIDGVTHWLPLPPKPE